MNRDALRLELLKLTYTHGRTAEEAVGRARELETFVIEPGVDKTVALEASAKVAKHPESKKKADTDIFK